MRIAFLFAVALGVSGCASVKPVNLDLSDLSESGVRAVATTERPMPALSAITPTKAQFGFLGGMAMASAGKRIVEENDVDDPAVRVSSELADQLAKALGAETISQDAGMLEPDVLVDVQTRVWQLIYYKSAWGTYSITYRAKAQFIDADTETVLGTGSCSVRPEKDSEWTASYEDFAENRDAILTRTLAFVARQCAAQIGGQLAAVATTDG
ncbi:hypothetical protein [Alloalcanivorax marinus]|uniref:hypothetical protein n=1 Tax=Alloalcanivorax marinus TaxID=1177169 RepID=UPI00195E172B|nr:hypothetical protein [Alloalcanivorax marinus]MBM7334324.1 hypothetical protein [Alloalcanivorax marinus]